MQDKTNKPENTHSFENHFLLEPFLLFSNILTNLSFSNSIARTKPGSQLHSTKQSIVSSFCTEDSPFGSQRPGGGRKSAVL